jgi:DNA-binding NtrC family response regulator
MNALNHNAILVFDPDPAIRALVMALLRREGYAAEATVSADEALRLHRHARHAAVILDPHVDGGDALLHALQTAGSGDAPNRNLIVMTTSEHSRTTYDGHPGVHAVLIKPFFLNELARAVAACCGGV